MIELKPLSPDDREQFILDNLEEFHITQPTLSHDMRVLKEAGIVTDRREGKNIYYTLNKDALGEMQGTLGRMFEDKPDCICHKCKND